MNKVLLQVVRQNDANGLPEFRASALPVAWDIDEQRKATDKLKVTTYEAMLAAKTAADHGLKINEVPEDLLAQTLKSTDYRQVVILCNQVMLTMNHPCVLRLHDVHGAKAIHDRGQRWFGGLVGLREQREAPLDSKIFGVYLTELIPGVKTLTADQVLPLTDKLLDVTQLQQFISRTSASPQASPLSAI